MSGQLIQADGEGDKTTAAPTTADTLWNINFIEQTAGTGEKVEGRKESTSLYVKNLKVAPDASGATAKLESSTQETSTTEDTQKKNEGAKDAVANTATTTSGTVVIVSNAVQPELVEE